MQKVRMRRAEAPKGLSKPAREFWARLQNEYEITDAGGLALLEQAARAFHRAEDARALLDKEGCVFKDKWDQPKTHPAAAVERDARAGLLAALRALNLDLEPVKKIGRPPGR